MTRQAASALLNVPPDATEEQLRAAWRAAARQWHPDTNPHPDAPHRFAEIRQAYKTLQQAAATPSTPVAPAHDPFAHLEGPTRDADPVHITVPVTIADQYSGQPVPATLTYPIPCTACAGRKCATCHYSGAVFHQAATRITPPRALTEPVTVRLPRRGAPGWGGGKPGTLTITFTPVPTPHWRITNGQLHTHTTVTWPRALLGGHIPITLPDQTRHQLPIPAGTTHTQDINVPGLGLPTEDGTRGPLIVTVTLDAPDTRDPKVRALLEQLDAHQQQSD